MQYLLLFLALAAPTHAAKTKVLWNKWYTVTLGKKKYSYFNERASLQGKTVALNLKIWKKNKRGKVVQEHEGAIAQNTPELAPIEYSLVKIGEKNQVTRIEGRFKGENLTTKIYNNANPDQKVFTTTIPKGAIFTAFFPVWINKNAKSMRLNQKRSFQAFTEENFDRKTFRTIRGSAKLVAPDPFAEKTRTYKVEVQFNTPAIWYVGQNGAAVRIVLPQQGAVIRQVKKSVAQAFLGKK